MWAQAAFRSGQREQIWLERILGFRQKDTEFNKETSEKHLWLQRKDKTLNKTLKIHQINSLWPQIGILIILSVHKWIFCAHKLFCSQKNNILCAQIIISLHPTRRKRTAAAPAEHAEGCWRCSAGFGVLHATDHKPWAAWESRSSWRNRN